MKTLYSKLHKPDNEPLVAFRYIWPNAEKDEKKQREELWEEFLSLRERFSKEMKDIDPVEAVREERS